MRAQRLKLSRGERTGLVLAVEDIGLCFESEADVRNIDTVRKRLAAKSSLTLPVECDGDEWERITDVLFTGVNRFGAGIWQFRPDPFAKIKLAQKLWREQGVRLPPEELD